jgi:rhamnulokinase
VTGSARVLAVDLGATSVRVGAVDLEAESPKVEVLHRHQHAPVADRHGSLRWDWDRIVSEVEVGLDKGLAAGPVASIGVDGWGVDYGLVDEAGDLVAPPFSYRDSRTAGWESIADAIGVHHLYQVTGIQLMGINTIFQLALHDRDEMGRAARVMLLPDLLVHHLVGFEGAERSNASTTGLMDARTGDWDSKLIEDLAIERSLFPEVLPAGTLAGSWRGIPVHLVGSHDTASAFLGMPGAGPGTVFVSSGTWVLVGIERAQVDSSPAARAANFSNEAGAFGGVRFLKNVVGLWILDQCRSSWGDPPIEALLEEASAVRHPVSTFDASDGRFLTTSDMVQEVREAAQIPGDAPRSTIIRSVLESIVDGVATVVDQIATITGENLKRIAVVGGGTQVTLMNELLAERTSLDVVRGSPEATALGNAMAQGIALGRFKDLVEGRRWLEAADETRVA